MKITDTLSGGKETFTPGGDEVKMYVCGVTPYADAHIGHAMSYIIFDVIRRYLRFRGYRVKYVQNVTDIDDKIIDRAARLGITPEALATRFTDSYFEDMAALNVEPADVNPRATGEISKILEVIEGLVEKDYAYSAQGSVYFRVRNVPDYGKLSQRNIEDLRSGTRGEPGDGKEFPSLHGQVHRVKRVDLAATHCVGPRKVFGLDEHKGCARGPHSSFTTRR